MVALLDLSNQLYKIFLLVYLYCFQNLFDLFQTQHMVHIQDLKILVLLLHLVLFVIQSLLSYEDVLFLQVLNIQHLFVSSLLLFQVLFYNFLLHFHLSQIDLQVIHLILLYLPYYPSTKRVIWLSEGTKLFMIYSLLSYTRILPISAFVSLQVTIALASISLPYSC